MNLNVTLSPKKLIMLQTFNSTRSTIRPKSKQHNKLFILRKTPSLSIKYTNQNSQKKYESLQTKKSSILTRRNTISGVQNKSRVNISFFIQPKPIIYHSKVEINCTSMCSMFCDNEQIQITHGNIHQKRQIASLTKIMTAFTVLNICNTYGVRIRDTKITVEKQASMIDGTSANLRNGDRLSVLDLLFGLLLPSGNDAALALAQYFGKFLSFAYTSRKQQSKIKKQQNINQFQEIKHFYDAQYAKDSISLFVFQMNKNCKKIKLKDTKFANPTGLSNKQNYSTASDICKLISFCMKNHLLNQIFKRKIYQCTALNQKLGLERQIQWRNTNKHLFSIRDCIGVKTGITPTAGPCLSSAYKINGRILVVVILNSRTLEDRYVDAEKIYRCIKSKYTQQQKEIIS